MKRWTALILLICLWCTVAQAGGSTAGKKDAHLMPQAGEYAPRYSSVCTLEVLPGTDFTLVLYEDSGTLPLLASPNGGGLPAGVSLSTRMQDGVRQVTLSGLAFAGGKYGFSVLVQEDGGAAQGLRTLAILHVTLLISEDAKVIEAYLGDGQGMLRILMDGVNFRRTPGGTRLGQYDEDTRMVWCSTQQKGGYTWYRVWTADFGYGWVRGDLVQVEPTMRLVYVPGKETTFPLFITAGVTAPLTPSLIMTEKPELIGFDSQPLQTIVRGEDTWTLLRFVCEGEEAFFIKVDLRDENGAPVECQVVYLTPRWEEAPAYSDR